jgi:hypothetical protein
MPPPQYTISFLVVNFILSVKEANLKTINCSLTAPIVRKNTIRTHQGFSSLILSSLYVEGNVLPVINYEWTSLNTGGKVHAFPFRS